jgi:glucose/arabinose dehydrogenase
MRRLLLPPFALSIAAAIAQAQDERPKAPEPVPGPAIVFEPAFPAQPRFDRPLFVAFTAVDPDTAYVVTQPGHVFRVPRDGARSERETFLDFSKRVFTDNWEEGLLGFAFDPGHATNGFVYIYWSEQIPPAEGLMGDGRKTKSRRRSVISRLQARGADGARAVDAATELRVMEIFQPFGNHNGGTIVFGSDGMLYVALGDGGAANDPFDNGQSKSTLLGKVLRIDVRGATKDEPYAIPADNPFVAEPGARGEIWCWGLRNPWRIAFDRATGDLWCGDVGQDRLEEVDRLVKGGNYGWNSMEASEVFLRRGNRGSLPKEAIAPIVEYPRREGLSITGGHVYRGARIAELQGCYVYGDFMSMRMWAVREDRDGGRHQVHELARAPAQLSSFAEEPDGELLATCFDGRVYRLVPAPK